LFRRVERSEPNSCFLQRVSDLGGEPSPRSFSNTSVSRLFEKNRVWTGFSRCNSGGAVSTTHLQRFNLFWIVRWPKKSNRWKKVSKLMNLMNQRKNLWPFSFVLTKKSFFFFNKGWKKFDGWENIERKKWWVLKFWRDCLD